jgi:hypothetical protein
MHDLQKYSLITKTLSKKNLFNEQQDEDECNLINKEDFEEGKPKEIVTARATPVKSNALARKNLSTVKKS